MQDAPRVNRGALGTRWVLWGRLFSQQNILTKSYRGGSETQGSQGTKIPPKQWPEQNGLKPPTLWGHKSFEGAWTRPSEPSWWNKRAPLTQLVALTWDDSVSTVWPAMSFSRDSKAGRLEDIPAFSRSFPAVCTSVLPVASAAPYDQAME